MQISNRQISKNLILTAIYFIVNTGINFCLSSYIINNIGIEANGFITLANSFIEYASLVTIALNSVAGRFISLQVNKGDMKKALDYYNSTLIADFTIGLALLLISAIAVFKLERIIQIPREMVFDVKILFALIFLNFFFSVMISVFSVSTFIANRMDLASLRRTEGIVIKAVLLIVLFSFFNPHLYYVSIVSIAYSLYYLIFNIYYIKKYCSELKFDLKKFSFSSFLEMISGGIWNTITQIGFILTSGLDLLICNKWLGTVAMGQMSFPKQLYNIITGFISTLVTAFQPTFVQLYAQKNIRQLINKLVEAMALCGILTSIILTDVFVYGEQFLELYIPTQDTHLIWILMILSLQVLFVSGTQYPLYYVYTLTNKLKINSMIEILSGILNVCIVFFLIRYTELDIYAVAGVSTSIGLIKNILFTPMYSAHCLNVSLTTFYPAIFKYMLVLIMTIVINDFVSKIIVVDSWIMLIVAGGVSVIIGGFIGTMILLNTNSRKTIVITIKNKFL